MSIVVRTWNEKESLILDGRSITLDRLGKTRVIPLSQIVSFTVEDPKGKMRPGTITIRLAGGGSLEDHISSFLNVGAGGGITFNHGFNYLEAAHEMQRVISGDAESTDQQPDKKVISVVEEIRGLKGLLDEGILTEEEFTAKKRQLLGL